MVKLDEVLWKGAPGFQETKDAAEMALKVGSWLLVLTEGAQHLLWPASPGEGAERPGEQVTPSQGPTTSWRTSSAR